MSMNDIREHVFPHECYFEQSNFEVTVLITDVKPEHEQYQEQVVYEITDAVFDPDVPDYGEPVDREFLYDQIFGYCEEMGWI